MMLPSVFYPRQETLIVGPVGMAKRENPRNELPTELPVDDIAGGDVLNTSSRSRRTSIGLRGCLCFVFASEIVLVPSQFELVLLLLRQPPLRHILASGIHQ